MLRVHELSVFAHTAFGDYCKQPQSCLSDVECLKLDIPSYVPPTQTTEEEAVSQALHYLSHRLLTLGIIIRRQAYRIIFVKYLFANFETPKFELLKCSLVDY